jgi:hypothetical protein
MERLPVDRFANLTLEDFAVASGFSPDSVIQARRNGELFSCCFGDELFDRYPAYQLLPEIRGQPLRALIAAVGLNEGPSLYMFMGASNDLLRGMSAIEVLCGRLMGRLPVDEDVSEILELDDFTRLQAVLKVANCWSASAV